MMKSNNDCYISVMQKSERIFEKRRKKRRVMFTILPILLVSLAATRMLDFLPADHVIDGGKNFITDVSDEGGGMQNGSENEDLYDSQNKTVLSYSGYEIILYDADLVQWDSSTDGEGTSGCYTEYRSYEELCRYFGRALKPRTLPGGYFDLNGDYGALITMYKGTPYSPTVIYSYAGEGDHNRPELSVTVKEYDKADEDGMIPYKQFTATSINGIKTYFFFNRTRSSYQTYMISGDERLLCIISGFHTPQEDFFEFAVGLAEQESEA